MSGIPTLRSQHRPRVSSRRHALSRPALVSSRAAASSGFACMRCNGYSKAHLFTRETKNGITKMYTKQYEPQSLIKDIFLDG